MILFTHLKESISFQMKFREIQRNIIQIILPFIESNDLRIKIY